MTLRIPALAWAILLMLTSGCGNQLDPVSVQDPTRVDARGAGSDRLGLATAKHDAAPAIQITSPQPSPLLAAIVTPTASISWSASNPDGPHGLPREIRYKLLSQSQDGGLIQTLAARPDSVIGLYAPEFLDWNVVSGKSTGVTLTGLAPNDQYLLIVTALDHKGLFDPVFSLSKNMLRMTVIPAGQAGARNSSGSPAPSAGTPGARAPADRSQRQ